MNYDAVLFISFGGPEKREDIRPFLDIVTRGRRIPPDRIEEVVHHYEQIGGASPINAITWRQAQGLEAALKKTDSPLPVYIGQRNWHPFLEDASRKMAADGVKRAIGFITAAHRCEASTERYMKDVDQARQKIGPSAPVIDYVDPWFDHPLFIDAIVARIKEAKTPATAAWLFTAHSIPVAMAKSSSYLQDLKRTAELVAQRCGIQKWDLAYTSRSGSPHEAWLEPDVCDWIDQKAKEGVRDVLAIPIGFVADHVEVLFDLDVEAKAAAEKAGVGFHRAQTVNDHPLFIQMMADVVRKK